MKIPPTIARSAALATLTVCLTLALATAAQAQTFTVTNLSDSGVSGDGSLRGEVLAANSYLGADEIDFASGLSGTIALSGGGLKVSEPLDIEGPGPSQITVAQSSARRVFDVEPTTSGAAVRIAGLHLAGGTAPNSGSEPKVGGDILNTTADLSVVDCLVTGGSAEESGGIESSAGPLTLVSSTVSGNHAEDSAGVSVDNPNSRFTIQSSTIAGNTASAVVGGLHAQTEAGGLIEGSTISGNTAEADPGVDLNVLGSAAVVVKSSTVAGNTATEGPGGGLYDIANGTSTITIEDSTVAGNHLGATGYGGGVAFFGTGKSALENTIVAGNTAGKGPDLYGTGIATAFSLIGNPSDATFTETVPGSDLIGVDPQLGALAANGGPTETMALAATSPAVNKGSSALASDQRGLPRPVAYPDVADSSVPGADGADIGAYELQVPAPVPPSNSFSFGKVKLNKKKGTASVQVKVPDAGEVILAGTKTVKKASKVASAQATLELTIKAKGRALKSLRKKGKVKVSAQFTFTPSGGSAASKSKTVKLVRKR